MPLNSTVETDPTTATFRQSVRNNPGSASHHSHRAAEASTTSTATPAATTAIRLRRSASSQASDTSQYRQGASTRIITPNSRHSPPKCVQVSPWPSSWRIFIAPSVASSQIRLLAERNAPTSGSAANTASAFSTNNPAALATSAAAAASAGQENSGRTSRSSGMSSAVGSTPRNRIASNDAGHRATRFHHFAFGATAVRPGGVVTSPPARSSARNPARTGGVSSRPGNSRAKAARSPSAVAVPSSRDSTANSSSRR
ncbi:hypothetical protein LzC2_38720 [Planctomycetes bacterium LzC2]|uniref:Uncharacterized protein n=1 Tax=Alienimonas chondri TaxID=2681879 RepID=A0ABX1VI19_9PLAN|nr:hypothetical protein [Alienimonas chondri]